MFATEMRRSRLFSRVSSITERSRSSVKKSRQAMSSAGTAADADDATGVAHWDARYSFSATGRKVLNRIDASFRFRDGLIVHHVDRFSFYRWSRQALGPVGLLLGWTPLVRNKVRAQAAKGLAEFRG